MPDKYDEQIELLTQDPTQICRQWSWGTGLFAFAERGDKYVSGIGCLTMIRGGSGIAATPELTKEIRADERLPEKPQDIKIEHLPVFAEWQRRLDKELQRA